MPTGYTAALMEKGQTFQEFIMGCARAFGALVEMRDSPFDAPIPDKFEPSDYHTIQLTKAREKLATLKAMSFEDRESFGQAEKKADVEHIRQWFEKDTMQNKRLDDMIAQVQAWNPPTNDHQELKDFMLQQLGVSKNDVQYIKTSLDEATNKPAMAYYVAAVSNAAGSIKYHTEEYAKEVERTNKRTEWVQQLRESI